jgi:hypothetical protein
MIYKYLTGLFIATTAVFAGLYFSGDMPESEPIDNSVTRKSALKESSEESVTKIIEKKVPEIVYKDRVVYKAKDSLTETEKKNYEKMSALYGNYVNNRRVGAKKRHSMLFARLNLDDNQREEFAKLLVEKSMINQMHITKDLYESMSDEEREQFELRKTEMREDIDSQISEYLGDDLEVYQGYREKQMQYDIIKGFEGDMAEKGEFDVKKQDDLAAFMHESRRSHDDFYEGDHKPLRESKESADSFLADVRKRYDDMIENAPVNDEQREVFASFLNKVYHDYKKTADYYERVRNNPDAHKRHRHHHRDKD